MQVAFLSEEEAKMAGPNFQGQGDVLADKVGIGVASPAVALDVAVTGSAMWLRDASSPAAGNGTWLQGRALDGGSTYQTFADIKLEVEDVPGTDIKGAFVVRTMPNKASGTTERLRITSTGNVGIGTTSPGEKLEVNGNVKATRFISQAADGSVLRDVYNEYLALSGGTTRRGSTSGGLIQLMGNARSALPGSIQYILGEGATSPKHIFYDNGSDAAILDIASIDNSGNLRTRGNIGDLESGRVAIDANGYCLYG